MWALRNFVCAGTRLDLLHDALFASLVFAKKIHLDWMVMILLQKVGLRGPYVLVVRPMLCFSRFSL